MKKTAKSKYELQNQLNFFRCLEAVPAGGRLEDRLFAFDVMGGAAIRGRR